MKKRVVFAVTGASGSIYAKILADRLQQLNDQIDQVGVVFSKNAFDVWKYELQDSSYENFPWKIWDKADYFAPFASGSAGFDSMIVCPCSMGTLGRIATGLSDDLITRAADVMLKERRKLILVLRETPYSLIHIQNMESLTRAGGIICPASPSFYSLPKSFDELAATVVDRALELAGFQVQTKRWQS